LLLTKSCHQFNVFDFYQFSDKDIIGDGKTTTVFKATHKKTGKQVAIKRINKLTLSKNEEELLRNEVTTMKLLNHPNIVSL